MVSTTYPGHTRNTVVTVAVLVIVAVLAALAASFSHTGSTAAAGARAVGVAVRQGNDDSNCRARFSGPVTDRRSHLDDTEAEGQQLTALDNHILGDGLLAYAQGDPVGEVHALVRRYVVSVAQSANDADTVRARQQLTAANNDYQALLRLETHHPAAFERRCDQSGG